MPTGNLFALGPFHQIAWDVTERLDEAGAANFQNRQKLSRAFATLGIAEAKVRRHRSLGFLLRALILRGFNPKG
jgi:hypothetical protein